MKKISFCLAFLFTLVLILPCADALAPKSSFHKEGALYTANIQGGGTTEIFLSPLKQKMLKLDKKLYSLTKTHMAIMAGDARRAIFKKSDPSYVMRGIDLGEFNSLLGIPKPTVNDMDLILEGKQFKDSDAFEKWIEQLKTKGLNLEQELDAIFEGNLHLDIWHWDKNGNLQPRGERTSDIDPVNAPEVNLNGLRIVLGDTLEVCGNPAIHP